MVTEVDGKVEIVDDGDDLLMMLIEEVDSITDSDRNDCWRVALSMRW